MAGPVATAIVAVAKFIGGVKAVAIGVKIATIATPLIVGGLKVAALAAVSKALTPKNKANGLQSAGSQMSFKADTQAGITFVLGRTGLGGNNIFQFPSGPANKYMNFFVNLCHGNGGPIQGITGFKANNEAVTFNGAGRATTGTFAGKMWMTLALGLMPATALAVPADLAGAGNVAEWTSAHKMSGYAAARWSLEYDPEVYTSGVPQPEWVAEGIKLYDPRKDSTYPGGSGAHRINNSDTWEYSENPALHGLQYCLGYFAKTPDGLVRVAGAGVAPQMIDMAAFVEAANVNDANGWKIGGTVNSLDPKWGALKAILQAGSAQPLQSGALISCRVDTPRSSLATMQESDLCGLVNVPAVRTRRDRKNSIVPRYRSEPHNWEIVSAAPVTSLLYQAEDGALRQLEVEYTLCPSAAQVAQLAAYDLVDAREIEPITLAAKPAWQGLRPGDCFTVNLPEMGLTNRKVVVRGRDLDFDTNIVSLTVVTETDGKHAFALGQSPFPPATPGLTPPDFAIVPMPGVGAWALEASQAVSSGLSGASIAVVGANDYAFTSEVVVRLRPVGTPEFSAYGSYPATTTRIVLTGLVEGNYYDVAISYRSIYGVTGPGRILTYGAPGLQPLIFNGVSDGDVLVFDPPLSGVPTFDVDMSGTLAPDPGDERIYRITDLTTTGAVVALKISDQSETTSHEVQASTQDDDGHSVAIKPTTADAYNGYYKFTVTVQRVSPAYGAPFYSFAPILVRPAGAAYPSGLIRIGEVGGSNGGPVASPTQSAGSDTYTVTLPCSVALGQDGGPQFYAINTGNVGHTVGMVVEYDTEVTGAVEIPSTDATHKATITFYPPGYTGAPTGSGIYFDNAAVAGLPVASEPEAASASFVALVGGVRKVVPYSALPAGGGGGDPDPYALSNIDSQGGGETGFNTALAQAIAGSLPFTGNTGTVTITGQKTVTGVSVHLPFKAIKFGVNLASVLTGIDYTHGSTGAPITQTVVGPAIELGGSPTATNFYSKVIRLVGDYTGNGANQWTAFTAVRIQTDQPARSTYDITLQNHRGDGLEVNSDTEKKVIDFTFDHIYEGYALSLRTTSSSFSPDEVVVNLTGTYCSNLIFAQDGGQFSYRVNCNVENVMPWVGSYAVDDCARKGSCYSGEIRSPVGDLIKVETRGSGESSGGPTVVFDSLRIIQHYAGRITIINPKSVGGTIYADQVDNSRVQSTATVAYRNSLVAGRPTWLLGEPHFQIGEVLENCTLTYVTRRNVCAHGARIGISDWVNPIGGIPSDQSIPEDGSPFSGKSIRLEIQMGDKNITAVPAVAGTFANTTVTGSFAQATVTGSFAAPSVTGSFAGTTFTVTAGAALVVNQRLFGPGIPDGMKVTAIGGGGVYTVSNSLTRASGTVYAEPTLTVTVGSALIAGQDLKGAAIPDGMRVVAVLGGGVYTVSKRLALASSVISVGTVLTVTSGSTSVGQWLEHPDVPLGTLVMASLGSGKYLVNKTLTLSSRTMTTGSTFSVPAVLNEDGVLERPAITITQNPFLKGAGTPDGLRIIGGNEPENLSQPAVYLLNRAVTAGAATVATGARPEWFNAIWADFGTASTIWADGNLAGNIKISAGWQRGAIHVSAAWVRAGFKAVADPLSSGEVIIHGAMDLSELPGIGWAFKGVKVLSVNEFDGAGAYYNGSKWVPLSPPLVPELSLSAMGSPFNAAFIKRTGLSVVRADNALPYYATGNLEASVWQTPGGASITPQWDAATNNFASRVGGLSTAYKMAFDRFIYDVRLAGVYTGNSATSKLKALWPLMGPSEAAGKNNLLFDFWDLDVYWMDRHEPGQGFIPYLQLDRYPRLEVLDWPDDAHKYGTSGQNLMVLASCGVLLNSDQSDDDEGGPYFTAGGNTAAFRACFHRLDGGNHAQMNAAEGVRVIAPSQGNSGLDYRIGMAWTPSTTSQSIRMFGGQTVTDVKTVGGGGSATVITFGKAHDYYLRIPIELAGLGSGDFTPDEAAATLAAVNTLRSALKALA